MFSGCHFSSELVFLLPLSLPVWASPMQSQYSLDNNTAFHQNQRNRIFLGKAPHIELGTSESMEPSFFIHNCIKWKSDYNHMNLMLGNALGERMSFRDTLFHVEVGKSTKGRYH